MNFLAHFWLTDRAKLPLAGALLGDFLRGPVPDTLPPELAKSVRLHRRVDALTDVHPRVAAVKSRFVNGPRRYAGILLDILYDHCLAKDWHRYSDEPLPDFAQRSAAAVAEAQEHFEAAGSSAPDAALFSELLQSYAKEPGTEVAIRRTARRLKRPEGLLDAMTGWRERVAGLSEDLPVLLADLERGAS